MSCQNDQLEALQLPARATGWLPEMRASVGIRRCLLLAGLCAVFAAAAWLIVLGADLHREPWWVWILFPLFFYAAAFQFFRTAEKLPGSERRAWLCFSLACLAEGSGELVWGIYDLFSGVPDPFPAPAYVGYFSFSTLMIVGFWHCTHSTQSRRVSLVQLGNLATLISATMLAYLFLFYGFLESPVSLPVAFISIGYCILAFSAFLFGSVIIPLRLSGQIRRVMLLVLLGVGMIAVLDYFFTYIVLNASYLKTNPLNGVYLLAACCFIWAGFERSQLSTAAEVDSSPADLDERARLWESLLLPVAVAGVLVIALLFRERLTSDLIPYIAFASTLFVTSLTLRSWWGQQLENQLRLQAISSESQLQIANRELIREMKNRARAEEDLRHSQKMEALGQLTGGVAHDFNNLLAVILGNLELADQRDVSETKRRVFLLEAIEAANRGASLTQRLLTLSRKQTLKPEPIDVGALLETLKSLLERTLGEKIRVEIRRHSRTSHCVADRAQLESVLLNLAINARDAMSGGGQLMIEASTVELDESLRAADPETRPASYVCLAIRDTGVGIPEDELDRVFDPFFTTKDIGKGTGLGLSMAYGFAKQSGGQIAIESTLAQGTEVRLYLPATDTRVLESAGDPVADLPIGRGERVMVVEDEAALRKFVVTLLEDLGYAVVAVADGEQALVALADAGSLDLLLSDVVLPGNLSGPQLAVQIEARRPGIRVLFMSGYAEEIRSKEGPLWPDHELLQKPFHKAKLARAVRATLDGHRPAIPH